jgi:hypothetical protein
MTPRWAWAPEPVWTQGQKRKIISAAGDRASVWKKFTILL